MSESIVKNAEITASLPDEEVMQKINQYSNRELKPEEVFTFKVKLCSNEVDRDIESFTPEALKQLAEMFKGKTGIKDHNSMADNQIARIFDTQIVSDGTQKTALGEAYTYIEAQAYIMRIPKNEDFIAEIEGGIKKEVSVSCSIAEKSCSVCNKAGIYASHGGRLSCGHKLGDVVDEKLCCIRLDKAVDAYEFSFVAIPAQRDAGTHKHYDESETKPVEVAASKEKKPEPQEEKKLLINTLSEVFKNF